MLSYAIFNGKVNAFALGHEVGPLQLVRRQQSAHQHPALVQLKGPYKISTSHTLQGFTSIKEDSEASKRCLLLVRQDI